MDWVGVIFFTGVLLGMVCMARINIRVFQWMYARGHGSRSDGLAHFIIPIRLRDTLFLELLGFLISIILYLTTVGILSVTGQYN